MFQQNLVVIKSVYFIVQQLCKNLHALLKFKNSYMGSFLYSPCSPTLSLADLAIRKSMQERIKCVRLKYNLRRHLNVAVSVDLRKLKE